MTHFIFDSRSSSDFPWLVVNQIDGQVLPPIENRLVEIPGRSGAFHMGRRVGIRTETIKVTIFADSKEKREQYRSLLASWLDTDTPRTFYYNYFPDRKYKAILSENTDLTRIVTDGEVELTFIMPDPRAEGNTRTQDIAGINVINDTDIQTEWSAGTLTGVVATTNGLELSKEGVDYFGVVNNTWESGTLVNVQEVSNEYLQLTKSGTDFSRSETNTQDFVGTFADTNIKQYEIYENFDDTTYNLSFTTPSGATTGWSRFTTESFEGSGCFGSNDMTPVPQTHKWARTQFSFTVPSGATNSKLTFMYRTSCEANYDFFYVYVNGTKILTDSGITPWKKLTYAPSGPGTYTVLFEYDIDGATAAGDNRCYIDNVKVTYDMPVTSDAEIVMSNLPNYSFKDSMNTYTTWRGSLTGGVTQNSGNVSIKTSTTTATGLDKQYCVTFPFTADIRINSPGGQSVYISDGTKVFIFSLPNTGGGYKWIRFRCPDNTTGYMYYDGVQQAQITSSDYTVNRLLIAYNAATATVATNVIDAVYFDRSDLGPQKLSYSATYQSQEYDINSVGLISGSLIDWASSQISPYDGSTQQINVFVRIADYVTGSPVYGDWVPVTDGGLISSLIKGSLATSKKIQWKAEFVTTDPGFSPRLQSMSLSITSGYNTEGYQESPPISNIQQVVKARNSAIYWTMAFQPEGTSVKIQIAWAMDNTNFGNWIDIPTNNQPIPGIDVDTDLSKATFKYKVVLTTTDILITPSIDRLNYDFYSAYKRTGERISPPVSLDLLNTIGESFVNWDTTPNDDPNVKIYSQVVDKGAQPDPASWLQLTNTGSMNAGNTGVNKELYTRQVLISDGMSTPKLHRQFFNINENASTTINYVGTELTCPIITATFIKNCTNFDILQNETGDRILINRSFVAGDTLVIDNVKGKVTVNGVSAMTNLSVYSDFICFSPGKSSSFTVTPTGVAQVSATWIERWK